MPLIGEPLVIMLIEDNPDHSELIIRGLREHRIANRVVHLADGEVALDYLLRRGTFADPAASPRPDVILLDLNLPRVDGLQVLAELKAAEPTRRIPVVIVTSSAADRDLNAAYDHHVNSYLVKPVDFGQFSRMLDDLGFYWLAWNRHPGS